MRFVHAAYIDAGRLNRTGRAADLALDPSQSGWKGSPTIVAKVDTVQLPSRQGKIFQEEPTIAVSLLLDALRKDRVIR